MICLLENEQTKQLAQILASPAHPLPRRRPHVTPPPTDPSTHQPTPNSTPQAHLFLPPIMRALLRGGKPHWNPTVRRMTVLVLEALRTIDEQTFNATAAAQWGATATATATARAADKKKGAGVLPAAQGASSSGSSGSVRSHVFAKPAPPPAVRAKASVQAAPKVSSLPQVKGAKSGTFSLTSAPWANKSAGAGGGAMAARPGAMGGAMAGRPGAMCGAMAARPRAMGGAMAARPGAMGGAMAGRPGAVGGGDGGGMGSGMGPPLANSGGGGASGPGSASGGAKPTGVFDCTPGAGK